MNQYGDISPRTAAWAAEKMLARAEPFLSMARFGQQQPIPTNKTNVVRFRRYNAFTPSTTPLVEGVTPNPDAISSTDVQAVLQQYGRRTQITDVIRDIHEDPVLEEYSEIMGEVAGQTQELIIYNAIRSGLNLIYAGTSNGLRTGVNSAITAAALNRAIRQLKRQNAKPITKMLQGTDRVGTSPIRPAFIAFVHPDLQQDLENITGYTPVANYGTFSPLGDNELGSFKDIRFMASTLYSPMLQAATANAANTTLLTNGSTGTGAPDVYPVVIVGNDSYATVSLAGRNAVQPVVVNPQPSDSDPLGQRGHVGFKMYGTACILNDAWMVRIECGVSQ